MALYPNGITQTNIDSTPSGTAAITAAAIGTAAIQVLAANANRKGFTIQNTSTRTLYLGISNTVTTGANFFTSIPSQGLYEWSLESIYTGAVFAIANLANGTAQVMELTP